MVSEKDHGLGKLIDLQSDMVSLLDNSLNFSLDTEEDFDLLEVFVLKRNGFLLGAHEFGQSAELFFEVSDHNWSSHEVISWLSSCDEISNIRRSSNWDHVLLVILEVDVNLDLSLAISFVLAVIGTVVVISNRARNLNGGWSGIWVFIVSSDWDSLLDFDSKFISTRRSVLVVIVSCDDLEGSWLSWAKALQETSSISERGLGSGVQELLERNPGSGEVSTSDGELHNTLFGYLGSSNGFEAWGNTLDLCLRDESAGNLKSKLGWGINWLGSLGEKDSDVNILESSSVNFELDVTRELTKSWVSLCNSIRWSDNLSNVKSV